MKLAWGSKVSAEFRDILYHGCHALRWNDDAPSALMACMAFESAETFNPSIKNPHSSGTGLIQFMDATARSLGTSVALLSKMTPEQQLRWVFKYFDQFSAIKTPDADYADIYMGILMPKFIMAPDNAVIISVPLEYKMNSGLDANRDLKITKKEAAFKIYDKLQKGLKPPYVFER